MNYDEKNTETSRSAPTRCIDKLWIQRCLDTMIVFVWTTHLVVMFWRGTWNLLDLYIIPNDMYVGSWISLAIGIVLFAGVNSFLPILNRHFTQENTVGYVLVSRLCTYLLSLGLVNHWRGAWNLQNHFMDLHWFSNTLCFVSSVALMFLLRSSSNILTPPMVNACDLRQQFFTSEPRLRTKPGAKSWNYMLDHVFSSVVITTLVATAWRSLWNIMNDVIIPDQFMTSNLVTWLGGLGLGLVLVAVEKPVARVSRWARDKSIVVQLLVEDTYTLLAIAVCIAVWRGWWNILEVKLLPGALIGGWLCHVIGYCGLALTCMSSANYNYSFMVDCESPQGIHWPLEFVQYLLRLKIFSEKGKYVCKEEKYVKEVEPAKEECHITVIQQA